MSENELSKIIIGEGIKIHSALGPGVLERVYCECLTLNLRNHNLTVDRETPIPVTYETVKMDCGYRSDLLVEGKVIIEVKSIEKLIEIHRLQLLTYLKFSNCKLGLLMNFNVPLLRDGIWRVVNKL